MITFEIFNYDKQEWEEIEYEENIFDDYIIDSVTKYETPNDWRIRLEKPNKKMKQFELKDDTHIVLKIAHVEKYLTIEEYGKLYELIWLLDERMGKMPNAYYVVNKDEPYADEVLAVIKRGEMAK